MNLNNIDISKLPADIRRQFKQLQVLHAEKKTHTYHYGFNNEHSYNRTETKIEVDNSRSTDVG